MVSLGRWGSGEVLMMGAGRDRLVLAHPHPHANTPSSTHAISPHCAPQRTLHRFNSMECSLVINYLQVRATSDCAAPISTSSSAPNPKQPQAVRCTSNPDVIIHPAASERYLEPDGAAIERCRGDHSVRGAYGGRDLATANQGQPLRPTVASVAPPGARPTFDQEGADTHADGRPRTPS